MNVTDKKVLCGNIRAQSYKESIFRNSKLAGLSTVNSDSEGELADEDFKAGMDSMKPLKGGRELQLKPILLPSQSTISSNYKLRDQVAKNFEDRNISGAVMEQVDFATLTGIESDQLRNIQSSPESTDDINKKDYEKNLSPGKYQIKQQESRESSSKKSNNPETSNYSSSKKTCPSQSIIDLTLEKDTSSPLTPSKKSELQFQKKSSSKYIVTPNFDSDKKSTDAVFDITKKKVDANRNIDNSKNNQTVDEIETPLKTTKSLSPDRQPKFNLLKNRSFEHLDFKIPQIFSSRSN